MPDSTKISFSEKRDFGGILNVTFSFIRQNIKELGLILLYIAGPFVLLEGIVSGIYQIETMNFEQTGYVDVFTGYYFLTIFIGMLAYAILIAVVYDYILLYINNDSAKITVEMVWNKSKYSVLPIFLYMFVIVFVVVLGFILLIIPGIYFMVCLSLIWIIKFNENRGFGNAFNRCFELIKGNWWKTTGLLIIGAIIQWVITFVFQLPFTIAVFVQSFHAIQNDNTQLIPDALLVIFSIIASLSSIFFVISLIILAFHYFSLVEEKEATGLLSKIENIK
jgi:hypothetical protein